MTGFDSKQRMAADKLQEPVVQPAPGYCKNCKDYTIEKPLYAQPAQEPVGQVGAIGSDGFVGHIYDDRKVKTGDKLYTTPPKREWVDLSDSQIEQVYYDVVKIHRGASMPWAQIQFGRALQALIKEKNNGT